MDKSFRLGLADIIAIIATLCLIGAFLVPAGGALRNIRRAAREITCADNERRIVLAALLYATDFREALPTRTGDDRPSPWNLYVVPRLPIVGLDTLTAVAAESYRPYAGLGGWAYVVRDYLKNNTQVLACPAGWYDHDAIIHVCDGAGWGPGGAAPARTGLTADGSVGYLWLPHRAPSANPCQRGARSGGVACADPFADVAHLSRDRPEVTLIVDLIYAVGRGASEAVLGTRPIVLYFNHAPAGVKGGVLRSDSDHPAAKDVPHYDPFDTSANDSAGMPLGSNACRLDGVVRWTPFADLPSARYATFINNSFFVW